MKITINKEFTTLGKVERTKEQMKEFKEIYTDGDLLRMFENAVDGCYCDSRDIVYCKLSAFPGGTMETDETHYSVDMLIEGWDTVTKIHFYISQSGEIDTRVIRHPGEKPMQMWDVKVFKAE